MKRRRSLRKAGVGGRRVMNRVVLGLGLAGWVDWAGLGWHLGGGTAVYGGVMFCLVRR